MVEVESDPKAGLLECQAFADDTVGYEPITIDIKQARGVVVTGRVTNKATGKPVDCQMYVDVLADNKHVGDFPPFLHRASMATEAYKTDADGKFRVVTIPGPVLLHAAPQVANWGEFRPVVPDLAHKDRFHTQFGGLGFYGYDGAYGIVQGNWCKVIEAKATDAEVTVNVELEPATRTSVKVVDADGKPVTGCKATGVTHVEWDNPTEHPDADTITVFNLEAKKERVLAVRHEKRNLVGTLTLTADTKDPVVKVGAAGTVVGRVVGTNGKTRAGLFVQVIYDRREVTEVAGGGGPSNLPTAIETNANGGFTVPDVFPGQPFRLYFHSGKRTMEAEHKELPKQTVAKPGDTLKLGDLKLSPAKDDE